MDSLTSMWCKQIHPKILGFFLCKRVENHIFPECYASNNVFGISILKYCSQTGAKEGGYILMDSQVNGDILHLRKETALSLAL